MEHKRLLALVLTAFMLLSAVVSCGKEELSPESAPQDAQTETTVPETTEPVDEFGRP
ncbi:MAG: hypothetical protein GX827_01720, partial [Clostridiales bacterium]|nr:hypothetical protein [Clostridiales bacterium]